MADGSGVAREHVAAALCVGRGRQRVCGVREWVVREKDGCERSWMPAVDG